MNTELIYIQGAITQKSLENLLNSSLSIHASKFALWYYPETKEDKRQELAECFKEYEFARQPMEPVTKYWNEKTNQMEALEPEPQLYDLNAKSIELLSTNLASLSENCDSIATYNEKQKEWDFALIFHEGMTIAKGTNEIQNQLVERQIQFSGKPPENW